jgi:catechol 2,3-dioxygenase-like lactoylglutathione lyase family enzyme
VATDAKKGGFPLVNGLNHYATRCRNAEETRHFYEDILGLPLAAAIFHDKVPSTGETQPYFHIFFEMGDGSYLAFFDLLDEQGGTPDPTTPSWVNHLALEVATREDLVAAKQKLEAAGIDVLGIVDHKWFDSIYFFDPNGIRLELMYRTASLDQMRAKAAQAHEFLATRSEKIAHYRALAGQPT